MNQRIEKTCSQHKSHICSWGCKRKLQRLSKNLRVGLNRNDPIARNFQQDSNIFQDYRKKNFLHYSDLWERRALGYSTG